MCAAECKIHIFFGLQVFVEENSEYDVPLWCVEDIDTLEMYCNYNCFC